jgi:hypothetical protein
MGKLDFLNCNWCGRTYERHNSRDAGTNKSFDYCSPRCEHDVATVSGSSSNYSSSEPNSSSSGGCLPLVGIAIIGFLILAVFSEESIETTSSNSSSLSKPDVILSNIDQEESYDLTYRSTCGDSYVKDVTWYRVVGEDYTLNLINKNYCGDAFLKQGDLVQVASFRSSNKAKNFADQLSDKTGYTFWVDF